VITKRPRGLGGKKNDSSKTGWPGSYVAGQLAQVFQLKRNRTTNTLDGSQSNYSSCIVFSYAAIEFGPTGKLRLRSPSLKTLP